MLPEDTVKETGGVQDVHLSLGTWREEIMLVLLFSHHVS